MGAGEGLGGGVGEGADTLMMPFAVGPEKQGDNYKTTFSESRSKARMESSEQHQLLSIQLIHWFSKHSQSDQDPSDHIRYLGKTHETVRRCSPEATCLVGSYPGKR